MTKTSPHIRDTDAPGKALILREALRLFAHKGLSATSIRDIAQATGLSNPALYKHFKTKDELAQVLFERLYQSHLIQMQKALATEADFTGKFRAFLHTRLRAYDEHPDATIFAMDNLIVLWPHMPPAMKSQTILTLLRDLVQLGRSDGVVDPNASLALHLSLIVGTLDNITRQIFFGTLSGPATGQLGEVEQLLRKALA